MTKSGPPVTVEVVTIGDELLLGHTIDTNAAFISRELGQVGFRVAHRATVGDEETAIADAVTRALQRAPIVICTGGLGPTQDDLTRPVVAKLFGAELEIRSDLLEALRERFRQRGIPMPARNVTQAEVPRGALVLPNRLGSAPGLALTRADARMCILLPGVPHELRGLIVEQVIPFLLGVSGLAGANPIRYRLLRTTGIAESLVAEKVDHLLADLAPLTLAFLPGFAGTDLRLTCWGDLIAAAADRALDAAAQNLHALLDEHVYGDEQDDLASVVGAALKDRGWRLAVAESCSGGLLGKRLTDLPGASDFFEGGVIAYSNELKQLLLAVSPNTLMMRGAVSEETVREMALGAQRLARADAALAITGIAGPAGGTPEKPVGTVWVAAALGNDLQARGLVLPGDREEIRERSVQASLALLWKMLRTKGAPAEPATAPTARARV